MDDRTREDFIKLFNQGFEEIVMPQLEEIDKRLGRVETRLGSMDKRLDAVETRLNSMERILDRIVDKQIDQTNQLKDNDQRLKRLESPN